MSKQVLKSGTNSGAMVREAAYAGSGSDFILHHFWFCASRVGSPLLGLGAGGGKCTKPKVVQYIHKLSVGQKEINETQFWLEVLFATEYISIKQFDSLMADAVEIMKLLTSSITTKKKNLGLL